MRKSDTIYKATATKKLADKGSEIMSPPNLSPSKIADMFLVNRLSTYLSQPLMYFPHTKIDKFSNAQIYKKNKITLTSNDIQVVCANFKLRSWQIKILIKRKHRKGK